MNLTAGYWWRPLRGELALLACLTVVLSAASVLLAAMLGGVVASSGCADGGFTGLEDAGCLANSAFLDLNRIAAVLSFVVASLPFVAGLILGSQLAAREIEQGNVRIAWVLDPSRTRWLLERVAWNGAVVVATGIICGVIGYVLASASNPGVDLGGSFLGYGLWGPIVIVRGLLSLAIGTVVGAWLGRVLPALLVSIILASALVIAALVVARTFYPTEIRLAGAQTAPSEVLIVVGGMQLTPDGTLIEPMQALALAPAGLADSDPNAAAAWIDAHYPAASAVISGSRMSDVQAREAAVLAFGVAVAVAVSIPLVRRRAVD